MPSGQTRLPVANLSPSQTSPLSSSNFSLPHVAAGSGSMHTPSVTTVHVFEHLISASVLPSAKIDPTGQTRLPGANLSPSQSSPVSTLRPLHLFVGSGAESTHTPSVTTVHVSEHVMFSTVLPSASTFPSGQTRLPSANLSPSQTSPPSKCPSPHAAEDAGSTHTPSVTTVHVFEHVMSSTVLPSASTFPSGQMRLPSANLSPSQTSPSSNFLLPHVAAGA